MADIDHITTDIKFKHTCLYCRNDLVKCNWHSSHEGVHHYKTTRCPGCGKEIRIKVNFDGSGHDNWEGKKEKKVRNKIKDLDWFIMNHDPAEKK